MSERAIIEALVAERDRLQARLDAAGDNVATALLALSRIQASRGAELGPATKQMLAVLCDELSRLLPGLPPAEDAR